MRSSSSCPEGSRARLPAKRLLAACLALVCLAPAAAPLDPGRSLSHYVYAHWGTDRGLLGGAVYAISTSPDGYLWIGTDRGLVRFDGYSFELIQQPLPEMPPIGRVRGLLADTQGNLWVRVEGARMLLYRNGVFSDAFAAFGVPDTTVTAVALDEAGRTMFSGLTSPVLRASGQKLEPIADPARVPGTVVALAQSRDGRIWLASPEGGLFVAGQDGVPHPSASPEDAKITALAPARNGGLWLGTDRGLRFVTPDGVLVDNLPPWTHQQQILTLLLDRENNLWAGTAEGLLRVTGAGQASLRRSNVEEHDGAVTALFEDRESNLWFGGPGGLQRLQDGVFTTFSAADGIPTTPMGPVFAERDGTVWFAPLSGGLYWVRNGAVRQVHDAGLDRDIVYSIDGAQGEVWVGRQRGGLTRIRRDGDSLAFQTYTEKQGLAQNTVYSVHRDRSGQVWAGTVNGGLSVLRGNAFTTYSTANGLSSNAVNAIAEDAEGALYVATSGGLDEMRKGAWRPWNTQTGLPLADVNTCFADSEGVLWIVTRAGLAYLSDGHVTTLHNLPNLLREQIFGITEDRLGFLWLSTSDHMLRIARQALLSDSVRATDLQSYGVSDGLFGQQGIRRDRTLVASPSGKVWISTSGGIASGDPGLTLRNSFPVHVRIDSVLASGTSLPLADPPRIPAGTRSLTFRYGSDSLSAPDRVRFRYKLDGVDPDWSEAVQMREVSYSNLGPGPYRFHVFASRDGSLWNSPETVASFSIDRAFWQTWWFRMACALALLLTIALLFRLRSLGLARQLNARFQERLSERTRIAQELHDTLLQSFQGLMLRFQTVDTLLPARPTEAKRILEEALDRADEALSESREAIQDIRSSTLPGPNLAQVFRSMMAEIAQEYAGHAPRTPAYSVVLEGLPRRLKPAINSEIQRIARESMRNSFQHAQAEHIEAEVTFSRSLFRIRFRDDGAGIDPAVLRDGPRSGHWGMIGMKERATRIGARLDVWSKPGAGTELDLSVPGPIAYDGPGARRFFLPFPRRFKDDHETSL